MLSGSLSRSDLSRDPRRSRMLDDEQERGMPVECEVWLDEKTEVGRYAFDQLPRAGDTISLPSDDGKAYRHFRVDGATHRAAGDTLRAATYLFVSKHP